MNFLKRIASFIFPIKIEHRITEVNGKVEVVYINGKYVLDSAHANYSFGGLHKVFQKAFSRFGMKDRKADSALILGFGSGSVASILQKEYQKEIKILGVEKDKEIIQLAEKYFSIDKYKNLNLVCYDAYEFVLNCHEKFDLIVVDVFVDRNVPDKLMEEKFLSQLRNLLSEVGILFFNLVIYNERTRSKGAKLFNDLNSCVGKTEWCRIYVERTENWIFISQK